MATRRQFLHLAAGAAALPALSGIVRAQSYPSRPITMIVPANAGGPTDTIGRILAQRMQVTLGQNVIIENIGGASGTLGTNRVVRAAPDGYTIGLGGWNHYVVNGARVVCNPRGYLPIEPNAAFDPNLVVEIDGRS